MRRVVALNHNIKIIFVVTSYVYSYYSISFTCCVDRVCAMFFIDKDVVPSNIAI